MLLISTTFHAVRTSIRFERGGVSKTRMFCLFGKLIENFKLLDFYLKKGKC